MLLRLNYPRLQDEGFKKGRFEIDYISGQAVGAVMPDLIRHPEIPCSLCTGFRLEFIPDLSKIPATGIRGRNDKSLHDSENFSSPAPPRSGSGRERRGVSAIPDRDTEATSSLKEPSAP